MASTSTTVSSVFRPDVLKGKVALVTGGGTGIGKEIATFFGLHGAKIAIFGRRKNILEAAVADLAKHNIEAIFVQGDVRSIESANHAVHETVSKFGRLDILVNNAAGNFLCSAEDLSVRAFQTVLEIDTLGTFNFSKAAFDALKVRRGVIINITATLHYLAITYQLHASAAKAGVDVITRNLAAEWGKHGIRVVGVAPGPIENTVGMARLSAAEVREKEDPQSEEGPRVPVGRMGTTRDIANACLFLASPAADYITGHSLVVDGGEWSFTEYVTPAMYEMVRQNRSSAGSSKKEAKL